MRHALHGTVSYPLVLHGVYMTALMYMRMPEYQPDSIYQTLVAASNCATLVAVKGEAHCVWGWGRDRLCPALASCHGGFRVAASAASSSAEDSF